MVNRALYHATASWFFKRIDVKFDYPPSKHYLENFEAVTNGMAVNWAQEVVFVTWLNRLDAPARAVVQPTTLARIRDLVRARAHSRAEDLGGAVARLGPLCAVTVECTDHPRPGGWAWRAAVVHAALCASLDTLTTLSLCVPLEIVPAFLPPALTFPRLHTLAVRLFTLPVVSAAGVVARADPRPLRAAEAHIGAFVARHTGSLCSLDFSMPPIYVARFLGAPRVIEHYAVDAARVLRAVPPVGQLSTVALSVLSTASFASLPPIATFLTAYGGTLRALTLTVGRPYVQWSSAQAATTPALLGALRLPQLADLSIRCTGTAWPADAALEAAVCACVRAHAELTALGLYGVALSARGAGRLTGARLRRLALAVDVLTPGVLWLFADNLPALHSLEIFTERWCECTGPDGAPGEHRPGEEYEFALAMRRARYPHWALRHLVLSVADITKYCAVAVVTALPALHTLNWTARTQYLAEQRKYVIGYPEAWLLRLKSMPPIKILPMAHIGSGH
ncbi:hypothetical protein HYPSUDRAFT_63832 [Hypholoma sublateritium FD-334 SS-4]|uniref:Uncharacterized protein n=1 Tax=Hypholoma sublateritium (strain FD-334 SS-4) TaxID=945553 RepID=A0A0D2P6M0_HYPSF|nr:hypothetical protein HYPSUDRAFT_63832 [Hypholoma sublateritium FD-334 SS-4]